MAKASLLVAQRDTDPRRLAGAGLGGAAVAYGLPRERMTQGFLTWGRKSPNPATVATFNRAEKARVELEGLTEPIGQRTAQGLVRTNLGRSVLRTPASWRMLGATVLGEELLRRNLPVTRTRLAPVRGGE